VFSPTSLVLSDPPAVAAPSAARPVVACVDNSQYLGSVCDHAAWLAARLGAGLELLHAEEPHGGRRGDAKVLEAAVGRLADEGVTDVRVVNAAQSFVAAATAASVQGACLVVGRRGRGHARLNPREVGASLAPLIEAAGCPVLVVGRLFLSLSRALVWPAAGSPEARADYARLVETTRLLEDMRTERLSAPAAEAALAPAAGPGRWAGWAGRLLTGRGAPPDESAPDESAPCDLVVLPRAAFLDPGRRDRAAALRILSSRRALLIV
jgi:hypothetical protein